MALGFYKSAVLINTVASAVGLTQVYLPKGRRPPRDVRPSQFTPSRTVVFTPLKPRGSVAVCGEGGLELHT